MKAQKIKNNMLRIQEHCVKKFGIRMVFSALFVLIVLLFCWYHKWITFETNDDYVIMSYVAGFVTGTPTAMPFLYNYLYLKGLAALYALYPNLPWYAMAFLFIIWLSISVVCSCCIKAGSKYRYAFAGGIISFCVLFAGIYLYSVIQIQFTTVSAISGAAAIALCLSYSKEDGKAEKFFSIFFEVFFLVIALAIRFAMGEVAVIIFVCTLILKQWLRETEWGHTCLGILLSLVIFMGVKNIQNLYCSDEKWQEYISYNAAMSGWIDHKHLPYEGNEDLYISVGWDETLYILAENWFFLDEMQNTETFKILNEAYISRDAQRSVVENIKSAFKVIIYDEYDTKAITAILAETLCLLPMALGMIINKRFKAAIGCLAWLGGTCALVFGLAYTNRHFLPRFPNAVFILAVTPAVLYVLNKGDQVLGEAEPNRNRNKKLLYSVFAILSGALLFYHGRYLVAHAPNFQGEPRKTMETYALGNRDVIYIYDAALGSAGLPFQVYPEEKPSNLIAWGGWDTKSPVYQEQIRINGFETLSAQDLLNDNVCLLATADGAERLRDYMKKRYPTYTMQLLDETDEFLVYKFEKVN